MTGFAPKRVAEATWLDSLGPDQFQRLKDVFEIVKQPHQEDFPQVLSLTNRGVVERDISLNEGQLAESYENYQRVEVGDFVLNPMDLLSGWVAISSFEGVISNAYFVFRLNAKSLRERENPKFYEYVLQIYYTMGLLEPFGKGVGRPENGGGRWTINAETLGTIPLPKWSADRQDLIVGYLDQELEQAGRLLSMVSKLLESLVLRRKALISESVLKGLEIDVERKDSNVSWMGQIPAHWKVARSRFLVDITTGSGDTQDADPEGAYPFYVRSDKPLRSNTFDFVGKAVLTAGDGAGVGKVFHLVDGKFKAHQRVYVMNNFRRVKSKYFFYLFSSMFASVALDGSAKSTVDSLRRPTLANMHCTVPPLEEQEKIVSYLDSATGSMDQLTQKAVKVIDSLIERRNALLFSAVSGRLDLEGAAHG